MSAPPVPCPSIEELEGVALGRAATPGVEEHLAACEACRRAVARLRDDNRFLSDFAIDGALPAPVGAVPGERRVEIAVPGYDIVREIHRGGQGVVYLARQRSTKRDVAIKVMKQGPFATLADRARFEREVESLARLDHPNLVAVHDAGTVAGASYFVMNYIDGRPLDEAVARLSRPAMLAVFIVACEAVHAAHLRGVMHRDLKPSNILVDRQGAPHVLDFGLAKSITGVGDATVTGAGQFVGSLPWASPEQVEGASGGIDLRTDVYSLGAILFQLLTGAPPFDIGSNLRDAVDDILYRAAPRPSVAMPSSGVAPPDDELDTITLKCLSKDRQRRYQSAGELARDLRRYLAGEPIEAKRDSAMYVLRKTLRRYRLRVAAAGGFVALLAGFGIVMTVLYKRSARLEATAVGYADELSDLLSESNIEQGRMAGLLGDIGQAEELLWAEMFARYDGRAATARALHPPPGPPSAYWALWELYRKRPCRRTLTPQPLADRLLTVGDDGLNLWTVETGGRARRLDPWGHELDSYALGHSEALVCISPDGDWVLSLDSTAGQLRRRGAAQAVLSFTTPPASETGSYQLSHSGGRIAAIDEGVATVWATDPPAPLARFEDDQAPLSAVALSEDDRLLAARDHVGGLRVWELDSGRLVARASATVRVPLHERGALRFSPDGSRLADAWMDGPGRIWSLGDRPPRARELSERSGDQRVLGFSPDGALLAIGDYDGMLRIFETGDARQITAIAAHSDRVRSLAFTADGRGIWTSGEGVLRLWDVGPDEAVRAWRIADDLFHSVDVSPDGRTLVAGGGLGLLHRIDRPSGVVTSFPFENSRSLAAVAFSPDGSLVAGATYANAVCLWNAASPSRAPRQLAHPNRVSFVSFSADGQRLATACDDGAVRIWRSAAGTLEREARLTEQRIPQVAFDPAGPRVAVATRDGALLMLDVESGACETWQAPTGSPLRAVSFAPDGRVLVAGGADRAVHVWDVARREPRASLAGHSQEIYCLAVSPDGAMIASGDSGGRIRLWHVALARPLATLDEHSGAVMSVRFTPDNRGLLSASLDGTIRIWDLGYYEQHIAGQVEARLRRMRLLDAPGADAWLAWAQSIMKNGRPESGRP